MSEGEWQECVRPLGMLAVPEVRSQSRKRRLLACACCRVTWQFFQNKSTQELVGVAELLADGVVTLEVLRAAYFEASSDYAENQRVEGDQSVDEVVYAMGEELDLAAVVQVIDDWQMDSTPRLHAKAISCLIRDIFGNPFQPVSFDPSWRTTTAVAIARGMYDSRDFSAMPILADSLQDADCADARILDHCRGPGPHVKGCWVVDLVLGKE